MKDSSNNICISIIIPAHNSELFLRNCMDSVIKQSYKNLEIIIIDNGSTDNTWQICEEYRRIDSRIKPTKLEKAGVSYARNVGIRRASGEYIMFLDSDDVLNINAVKTLVEENRKNHVDVIRYNYAYEKSDGNDIGRLWDLAGKTLKDESLPKVLEYLFSTKKNIPCYPWTLFIRKKVIVFFDEKLHKYEDVEYMVRLLLNIKSISFLDKILYNYSYNYNSATKDPKKALSNISEMRASYSMVRRILAKNGLLSDKIDCGIKTCMFCLTVDKLRIYAVYGVRRLASAIEEVFEDLPYGDVPLSGLTLKLRVLYKLIIRKHYYIASILIYVFRIRGGNKNA